jgi:glycosyltransferase involved in cell wall biosynthesis
MLALEKLGMDLQVFSISNPREEMVQPQTSEVHAAVRYLDASHEPNTGRIKEHFHQMRYSPRRYANAFWYTIRGKEIDAGYSASSRFACFLQAVYLAKLLQDETERTGNKIRHIHAHFAHDPTFIAYLVHLLTGISYSFTAHARDLYQLPIHILIQRVEHATSVITCCQANVDYLNQVLPASLRHKVHLIHHGIDLQSYPATQVNQKSQTPLILSVGRLVEKKGFIDLLQACMILNQAQVGFRCEIYGEGPLRDELQAFINREGLADQVILAGVRTQKELIPIYQQASIFALTPTITEDGDRDGIPNVIVEAMASGLPVVSTTAGGIPEIVHHNENGLLFSPHDSQGIAAGLADLLSSGTKREHYGREARNLIMAEYDIHASASQLASLFKNTIAISPAWNMP